jgi:hypothetical protein
MKKHLVRQTLIIALIALSGFAFSQEAVLLKYNFVKGKTYLQNSQVTNNVTQTMGAQEMKMLTEVKTANEFNFEGVENGGTTTALISLLNTSIRQARMGRDTTMNFKDLRDKIRVVYSVDGKSVSTVKVDSSETTKMIGSMKETSKLQFLPNKSLTVGEKWTDKVVESNNMNGFATDVNNEFEYTLVGKESKDGKEYYKISFTGTMSIKGKGSQMGMEMFLEGTGKTEGFNYFDKKTSMIVYTESQTEMDMNIAVSGQQNMTIPMTQSTKTIITFEEKK